MRHEYHITITGDRYPTYFGVIGSSWQGAISEAIRSWKKKFKGSRTKELRIVVQKITINNEE
jgi:hypothetical protein